MGSRYLIDAANSMVQALQFVEGEQAQRIDSRSLLVYLSTGCKTLRILERDEELFTAIDRYTPVKTSRALDHLDEFISTFVKIDRGLMLEAGMHPRMVDFLFRDAEKVLRGLKPAKPDTGYLRSRIKEMGYTVCKEAEAMEAKYAPHTLLRGSFLIIGGAAIISVNLAADIASLGTVSGLSQAFGAIVMDRGFLSK